GAAPLLPELDAIAAATTADELAAVGGRLMRSSVSLFFAPYINNDINDTTRYITYFSQAGLGLPDESYYREDKYADTREAYTGHVGRALTLAGVVDEGGAAEAAQKVMAFETELASHHWDSVKTRDPQLANNPRTWAEIASQNPGFAWDAWAKELGLDTSVLDTLNVDQPDFLEAGASLWTATDLEVLKLWLMRKIVDARSPLLSRAFVEENFDFYSRTLAGTEELRPRWKRGLG
ncbi:peptidase M13, partial [Tsukamurella conjunctivitidis]